MRHPAFLAAILAATIPLSACGYSVFDAAEDISSAGFEGGTAITTAVQSTQAFTEVEAIGPDNVLLSLATHFRSKPRAIPRRSRLCAIKLTARRS